MSKRKELQERRNKLATQIREMADAFNANDQAWKDDEQRQNWEKLNADYDQVGEQLARENDISAIEERINRLDDEQRDRTDRDRIPGRDGDTNPDRDRRDRPQDNQDLRCLAMAGWCRSQLGEDLTREQVQACKALRFNPRRKTLRLQLPGTHLYRDVVREFRSHHHSRAVESTLQSRAMSAYTLGKGGILAPDSFVQTLEINMLAFGGIRQVADLIVTSGGEEMVWPTADDTGNEGVRLGESKPIGGSVEPNFGAVTWGAYKYSSQAILVPFEVLGDSVFDVPGMLGQMMGERIGRKTAKDYTTGSGAAGPRGILEAAALGKTAASATAITADELFDLVHSVDPAYRSNAGFMMHDNIVLYLRKLKDGEGRYIWQNGLHEGQPDRILGFPLTVSMEMPNAVATGNKTILFGQLNKYKIRRANQARLYRLEERYRDNDQDGFILLVREDGNLLTAGTAPVKYLQQA